VLVVPRSSGKIPLKRRMRIGLILLLYSFRPSEKPANTRSLKSAINSEISAKKRGEDVDQDIMDGSYSGW